MYDLRHSSNIKNEKVMRWRMQLSEFDFQIVFRPGKLNSVPGAISRAYCASLHESTLYTIHASLCRPGITRIYIELMLIRHSDKDFVGICAGIKLLIVYFF